MLRPAPEPAARDCRAPKEAMGFTDEVLLEVGEEPAQGIFTVNVMINTTGNEIELCYSVQVCQHFYTVNMPIS